MKTMLIYDRLVTLHREQHRHLKLAAGAAPRFDFARATNSVLLAASEMPQAALSFPCVFIESGGHYSLAALVGLRDHENLFVAADGSWPRAAYVPAFFRRYPFVLAESEQDQQQFTVCIDQACPALNADSGQPLFDEAGRESAWLQQVMQFLVAFRQDMLASREFADALAAAQLLQPRSIEYTLAGQGAKTLSGFLVVDEARLKALPAELLKQWAERGWLGLVYAHLLSLNLVPRLALRLEEQLAASQAAPASDEPAEDEDTDTATGAEPAAAHGPLH